MSQLAPYAAQEEESAGRRHPEPPHPYRGLYQRDRDRIIHSRAFRRLQAKTQVFTRRYSDHFRNRLTHTLEVAQISRTVARALSLNEDLAETLALVHDIGHPPFGHAGEEKLDEFMKRFGSCFDHNLHALRTVETFEQRYPDFPGLNLSFEVREGIIKHSRDYGEGEAPGLEEYRLAERPPLEAQIIDWADEIAYNVADLDDGLESGLLTAEQLLEGVPVLQEGYERVRAGHPEARRKLQVNLLFRNLINEFTTDLIHCTRRRLSAAGVQSVADVRRHANRLAALGDEMGERKRSLKQFLHENLYRHPQIAAERARALECMDAVLEVFSADPDRMPPDYAEQARQEPRHRVVCDYIAGMTDDFLFRAYKEHAGD